MTTTVEVKVWAIFSLPVVIPTVASIRHGMTFNFGDLNAHARDSTVTSG